MATASQITINTSTATLLAECTAAPALSVLLRSTNAGNTYLGGSGLTASSNGYQMDTSGAEMPFTLAPGESLYAISATGSPVVSVLTWQGEC